MRSYLFSVVWQIWNKLLASCNKVDYFIGLVTSCPKKVWYRRSVLCRQSRDTNRNILSEKTSFLFLSDEEPMVETLDYTIRIGSTPTFLYKVWYRRHVTTRCHQVDENNVATRLTRTSLLSVTTCLQTCYKPVANTFCWQAVNFLRV